MNEIAVAPWAQDRDEQTLKAAFAASLLRFPNDPFKAAQTVFPMNDVKALTAAQVWLNDPFVINKQAELIEEFGEENFLPSKLTLARRVFDLGERDRATQSERLAAYRLYAELRGFMPKTDINQTNITLNQNRVMVLTDHGNDSEWESKVAAQQAKLIEHVRD